ncbi:hypothetical protein CTI12_AA469380 [Artemisia annua]|uniref:Uncharacterized protein n=1 Tax=Artemisia annua TaxID=35608 RepID=A0A2U1LP44_ARTAN|nr:hypothetical protein CTI12_AA469380 [Artemisia annua]
MSNILIEHDRDDPTRSGVLIDAGSFVLALRKLESSIRSEQGLRFTCEGTVASINTTADWFYTSCTKCTRKSEKRHMNIRMHRARCTTIFAGKSPP